MSSHKYSRNRISFYKLVRKFGLIFFLLGLGFYFMAKWHSIRKNESLYEKLSNENLPEHVALIMDGNGRWAINQNKHRSWGHQNALPGIHAAIRGCIKLGIPYLTLYSFSMENWSRPEEEINTIMQVIKEALQNDLQKILEQNVRIRIIGALEKLSPSLAQSLVKVMDDSKDNTGLTLTVAISYSGRWDLVEAMRLIASRIQAGDLQLNDIDDSLISHYLTTSGIPDPSLIIRTSGEQRISNFLLWQMAYSEFFFTPVLWPDFREHHLYEAIASYQRRSRRFGKIK